MVAIFVDLNNLSDRYKTLQMSAALTWNYPRKAVQEVVGKLSSAVEMQMRATVKH